MKVYCAEAGGWLTRICRNTEKFPKFNILFSFFTTQNLENYMPFSEAILIDSGAFSLQGKNLTDNDVQTYFKKYKEFILQNHEKEIVNGFFELDISDSVGYAQVKEWREELLEITDKIIPVWHKQYGVKEFKKLTHDYDYISLSCVNDRSVKPKSYYKFVNYAHKNNCKIHGLGMLRPRILNQVPFDSVDGTGWLKAVRFGKLDNNKINSQYIRHNQSELVFIELMKHIRFQEQMYRKWRFYHHD